MYQSPKRKKIQKKSSELNNFRLYLIKLINREAWGRYVELRITPYGNFGKVKAPGRKPFETYTDKQKVDLFVSMTKEEQKMRLGKCLRGRGVKLADIKNIYNQFIPSSQKKMKLTKEGFVASVISYFCGEELDTSKRDNEKGFISESDLTNMFVEICGVECPKDIIILIFSFLTHDMELIEKVGSVCKNFYLTILSSWDFVQISKKSLYKISLLVLKSAKVFRFNGRLNVNEIQYLFENLSHGNHVRKISFKAKLHLTFIRLFFKELTKWNKKNSTSIFKGVRKLVFDHHNYGVWNDLQKNMGDFDWKGFELAEPVSFPRSP